MIGLGRMGNNMVRRLLYAGHQCVVYDIHPEAVQALVKEGAVGGRALIYIHKERELDDVEKHYPARHYVLVDDKLRILTAVKKVWGSRLTTIFPRQGHYASDSKALGTYPPADITIECIGDLLRYDLPALLRSDRAGSTRTTSKPTLGEKR
ncbi:MAG: NAD(P)-binding domain-containing protein [Thermoguttaceae bacterium]